MSFCKEFEDVETASNKYPNKECFNCDEQVLDNGLYTCRKLLEYVASESSQKGDDK